MRLVIRAVMAGAIAVAGVGSAASAASALSCLSGATCRWHDGSYTGKKATATGDNADYTYPNGQNQWDDGSTGLNDNVSSLTNYGTSCWITFYWDSGWSGASMTYDRVNGAYQWEDPNLTNGGGFRGEGSGALGGTYNGTNWDNQISSHDFCS